MLALLPGACSDTVWYEKRNGKAFWHLLYHMLSGAHYWLRVGPGELSDFFPGKTLYPDFEHEQNDTLTKDDINRYMEIVRTSCDSYFQHMSEDLLTKKSPFSDSFTHMDLILMLMRHIQYHVGECNTILKENNCKPAGWIE
jgi:uncharacterized damage-inducible protein DinB